MNNKISIRFFDDREVRAAWDEKNRVVSSTTQLKFLAPEGMFSLDRFA